MKGISASSRLAKENLQGYAPCAFPSVGWNQPVVVIVGAPGGRWQSHKEEGCLVSTSLRMSRCHADGSSQLDFSCMEPLKIWGFICFPNRPVL